MSARWPGVAAIGLLVATLLVAILLPPSTAAAQVASAFPPSHPCAQSIAAVLQTWDARLYDARNADGSSGLRTLTIPTNRLGAWVVLQLSRDSTQGAGTAALVEPRRTTRRSWSSGCRADAASVTETAVPRHDRPGAFTDNDLARTMRQLETGVIYLWTPHMPLSISGYRSISAATARLGLALVPLLDPRADPDYAVAAVTEAGMPAAALHPLASIELTFRNLTTHAPSVQIFAGGRLLDAMLPGYRDAEYYAQYITARLAASGY